VCHYGEDNHEMSSIASDRRYWCQFESSISNNWTQKQKKKKKKTQTPKKKKKKTNINPPYKVNKGKSLRNQNYILVQKI